MLPEPSAGEIEEILDGLYSFLPYMQTNRSGSASRFLTAALAQGRRRLAREIKRRKAGEILIKTAKRQHRVLLAESHVMQRKLRMLTRQVISAHEEERKEISRELHDEIVQTLVGINVQLAALGKGASIGLHSLKERIALTQKLVANSVDAVHQFARELRPAVLDDLGLIPALHNYCKELGARKDLKIELTLYRGVEHLASDQRTALYRVAQEALTNVVRHARAKRVFVTIRKVPGSIQMDIKDNGRSFQVGKALLSNSAHRLGLIGMKERIEMVGGSLAINSILHQGTTVTATVPLHPAKSRP